MSFKKTDLAKQMASKLKTQMKGAPSPQRFGKQSATLAKPNKATAPADTSATKAPAKKASTP